MGVDTHSRPVPAGQPVGLVGGGSQLLTEQLAGTRISFTTAVTLLGNGFTTLTITVTRANPLAGTLVTVIGQTVPARQHLLCKCLCRPQ